MKRLKIVKLVSGLFFSGLFLLAVLSLIAFEGNLYSLWQEKTLLVKASPLPLPTAPPPFLSLETEQTDSAELKGSAITADARPVLIKNYLEHYHSPLLPHADLLFQTAQKYGFDYRMLVAIAQQESNLCKKIPEGSHNCWGWGIHSRGTLMFDSYPEAIEAVAKGLSEDYLGEGLITPEMIMAKYTPLSSGSWANGVRQFMDEIEQGPGQ